jgi:hypothetical protein
VVGPQPVQAAVAGIDRAHPVGVLRQNLRHQEHIVAAAEDRVTDQPFGGAVAVHLGGVDEGHLQVEAQPQRGELLVAAHRVLTEAPSALPQHGNLFTGRQFHHPHAQRLHQHALPRRRVGKPPGRFRRCSQGSSRGPPQPLREGA